MIDRVAELDEMSDEQAIASLEREFHGWLIYRGMDRLCHGRNHDGSPEVRGEDWVDLRDQIIGYIGRR